MVDVLEVVQSTQLDIAEAQVTQLVKFRSKYYRAVVLHTQPAGVIMVGLKQLVQATAVHYPQKGQVFEHGGQSPAV